MSKLSSGSWPNQLVYRVVLTSIGYVAGYPVAVFWGGPQYHVLAALYVVPLATIALFRGRRVAMVWASVGAIYAAGVTVCESLIAGSPYPSLWRIALIIGSLLFVFEATALLICWVSRTRPREEQALSEEALEQERSSSEPAVSEQSAVRIETLLCVGCGKIWDERGNWSGAFGYLSAHKDPIVTSGICPDCLQSTLQRMSRSQTTSQ